MKRGPKPKPPIDRFMKYVETKSNGCWLWTGGTTHSGYGVFYAGTSPDGSRCQANSHRWIYEHHNGPIRDGLFVCHTCDCKSCVNPAHLFLGTNSDNIRDAVRKGIQVGGRNVGTSNGRAVLTPKQVLKIRALREKGWTTTKLAKLFGLSDVHIGYIIKRKAWAHI
jgi:hypothetical protein